MLNPEDIKTELRDQLSSSRRKLGFFLGAGASMAAKLPGITTLTKSIIDELKDPILKQMHSELKDNATIEDMLTRIRTLKGVISKGNSWTKSEINIDMLDKLDKKICNNIVSQVKMSKSVNLEPYGQFSRWVKETQLSRMNPVEIFTTNYDVLLETMLDRNEVEYFDGFVGTVEPFFDIGVIESDGMLPNEKYRVPAGFIKLWKLHGSINWRMISAANSKSGAGRLVRMAEGKHEENNLMIFPSTDKYVESRKMPYLAYHDRLKYFLSSGEVLFVITGYSFGDEHINEVIFQAMRRNPRLSVTAFMFEMSDEICGYGKVFRNLTLLGPKRAVIGGVEQVWQVPGKETDREETPKLPFEQVDFGKFADFLIDYVGWGFGG